MPMTKTVLQNVQVLTAGQTIEPDPQGRPHSVNVVTLLVDPEDSQRLQLASSQGNIQFVLRSGADQKQAELMPTRLDQLFPSDKPVSGRESSEAQACGSKTPNVHVGSHSGNQAFGRKISDN